MAYRWSTLLGEEPKRLKIGGYLWPRHIIWAVAKEWDIQPRFLLGRGRETFAVIPRQIAMAITYHLCACSLPRVGKFFDSRDHTTILHAVNKMQVHIDAVMIEMRGSRDPEAWAKAMKARLG